MGSTVNILSKVCVAGERNPAPRRRDWEPRAHLPGVEEEGDEGQAEANPLKRDGKILLGGHSAHVFVNSRFLEINNMKYRGQERSRRNTP